MSSNNKQNKQTVGAQIPDRLFQVINLHSLVRGQSKSQIIRDALLLWMERNNVDINALIQEIFANYEAEWLRFKNKNEGEKPDLLFHQFLENRRDILKENKVSEQIINRVIKRLENETDQ